eukprot:8518569-Ditylum_brightwellii.AAC.1
MIACLFLGQIGLMLWLTPVLTSTSISSWGFPYPCCTALYVPTAHAALGGGTDAFNYCCCSVIQITIVMEEDIL